MTFSREHFPTVAAADVRRSNQCSQNERRSIEKGKSEAGVSQPRLKYQFLSELSD
jgi:hypothetical protein